ncbi:NUDIX domain-containing protein, partial [Candidatus Pacearchaeota archaeon]|nr:NUDIX domain-containing protein [Candidatus Pacearchaeota archaeon]
MKYTGSLVKKEREQIFKLFLKSFKLKFNEIEKETGIRSNMVSYHLEIMQKEGLLEKRKGYYLLTKNAERYMPIFSNLIGKELSALPVILIALINKNKILLMKRIRRPYKNYWSLIGGKMLLEEDFETASLRLVKEKTNLDCEYASLNSVLHERVQENKIVKHSFILF